MKSKIDEASQLFRRHFSSKGDPTTIAVAPGRVNLIGEHTDYTGGFVLPFAIEYSTVIYGSGSLKEDIIGDASAKGPRAKLEFVSSKTPDEVAEYVITLESTPSKETSWTDYVTGTGGCRV